MRYTVLHNIQHNTNYFSAMLEAKTILEPAEKSNYKSLHLNKFNRRYLGNNDEDIKMPDIKHIIPRSDHFISKRIIFT